MANKLKSFDEIRAELNRIGIARFYHNAVTHLLLRMFDEGGLPNKEPLIEVGKKVSDKTWRDFYAYHLYKQMLDDIVLMDAYLLGEQIVPKFGTKTIKNKTVKTVKFYPESRVKHVIIFEENKNGQTKINETKNG